MRSLLLPTLAVVVACGGTPKQSTAPIPGTGADPKAAECEPGRCLEQISKVIEQHRGEARACYDAGLKRTAGITGRLIINFEIDGDGVVIDASQGVQDNQITEPGVVACVGEVVKKITFAKSPTSKRTRGYHRFEFSPH